MLRFNILQTLAASLAAFIILSSTLPRGAAAQATLSGKELFDRRCGGCHALDGDKEGPRLRGVYGRVAGSIESFQYSEALKKSKIKWTDDTLDKWLKDGDTLVPDNDMAFHVESPNERSEIIAFLKRSSAQ